MICAVVIHISVPARRSIVIRLQRSDILQREGVISPDIAGYHNAHAVKHGYIRIDILDCLGRIIVKCKVCIASANAVERAGIRTEYQRAAGFGLCLDFVLAEFADRTVLRAERGTVVPDGVVRILAPCQLTHEGSLYHGVNDLAGGNVVNIELLVVDESAGNDKSGYIKSVVQLSETESPYSGAVLCEILVCCAPSVDLYACF